MVETSRCPSPSVLSAWIVEELPPGEEQHLLRHAASCTICAAELEALRAGASEYEAQMEVHEARLLGALAEQEPSPRRRPWLVPAMLALAATLAALGLGAVLHQGRPALAPEVSFKGSLAAELVAKRGDAQLAVEESTRLRAGDALRVIVTSAAPGHLAIFSIDGKNNLSNWYPEPVDAPALALKRGGRHVLPGSFVLDDAPGPEQLFVVFSRTSFDLGRVRQRVKMLLDKDPGRAWKRHDLGVDVLLLRRLRKAGSP